MEEEQVAPADLLVFTHDRPDNRHLLSTCQQLRIRSETGDIRRGSSQRDAITFGADLLLSVHYRTVVPQAVLESTRVGGMNMHPSLLPRHRGTFAAPWAIIDGDSHTGVTFHHMTDRLDEGDVVMQRRVRIAPDETAIELFHRLVQLGLGDLGEALRRFLSGDRELSQQRQGGTYHRRIVPFGGMIDPAWDRARADRFIRALTFPPLPYARMIVRGEVVDIPNLEEFDRRRLELGGDSGNGISM